MNRTVLLTERELIDVIKKTTSINHILKGFRGLGGAYGKQKNDV